VWQGKLDYTWRSPRAAWNGSEYLLTWNEYRLDGPYAPYVLVPIRNQGLRLNASLVVIGAPRVLGDVEGNGDAAPSVASDGHDWLLIWQFNDEVRARRIGSDGEPVGSDAGIRIASGFVPEVVFDGSQYAAAWKSGEEAHDVRITWLPRAGSLLASEGSAVASTFNSDTLSLVNTEPKTVTLTYTRIADAALGFVPRAFVQRVVSPTRRRSAR
jgi:hypothetical protein